MTTNFNHLLLNAVLIAALCLPLGNTQVVFSFVLFTSVLTVYTFFPYIEEHPDPMWTTMCFYVACCTWLVWTIRLQDMFRSCELPCTPIVYSVCMGWLCSVLMTIGFFVHVYKNYSHQDSIPEEERLLV